MLIQPSQPSRKIFTCDVFTRARKCIYIVIVCNIPKGPAAEAAGQQAIAADSFIICAIFYSGLL